MGDILGDIHFLSPVAKKTEGDNNDTLPLGSVVMSSFVSRVFLSDVVGLIIRPQRTTVRRN